MRICGTAPFTADVYDAMYGLNAIQKGSYLTSAYGLGGTLGLNFEAEATGEFANTIGTRLTPGFWLFLGGIGQGVDSTF